MKTKLKEKKKNKTDISVKDKSRPVGAFGSDSIFGDHTSLFAPLQSLRQEVDEIFNQFNHRFSLNGQTDFPEFKIPATDLDETDDSIEITTELPGMDMKDIDVTIENSMLKIRGEREQSNTRRKAKHRVSERSYGVYERSIALPFEVAADDIEANYEKGVLHLSIPKPAQVESTPQKIEIKSAS
ncbi:MAG: Hsp20/alpha crystallin family protein [Hyphomonadaceae bacterium]|nr:Hsp20/alpha crystallin family protein [Hyphomonadaceae bacterium]